MSVNEKSKKELPIQRVVPRFPPDITIQELLEKAISKLEHTGQVSRIPNAFIAYRMAVCKELHSMNHPVITQPQLSSITQASWVEEPEHVRKEYQRISAEAREIFKKICHVYIPPEYQHEFMPNDATRNAYWNHPQFDAFGNFDTYTRQYIPCKFDGSGSVSPNYSSSHYSYSNNQNGTIPNNFKQSEPLRRSGYIKFAKLPRKTFSNKSV
ncbi:9936_t:CDS:2 [Ambispora leptoticha]|uniref:9936_t:CDS:1 n=1 Tax=Ambispora leptoticha TaxID=144679 RepID=A0A9N8WMH4_9GLOM|nr:9936_t:CDS:2 [Ambispora leptoticha]